MHMIFLYNIIVNIICIISIVLQLLYDSSFLYNSHNNNNNNIFGYADGYKRDKYSYICGYADGYKRDKYS